MKGISFPLFLLFSSMIAAISVTGNAGAETVDTLEFSLDVGSRVDQIDWNIAGNLGGQDINVLSELEWKNLDIWQVGAKGKLAVGSKSVDYRTYIRASLDYGWLTDGTGRDSDYHGNNRTMEISRSTSETTDNGVFDGSIGLGFEKNYWQNRCTLGWLGGYSYHEQNLRLTDGMQIIPVSTPIAGLDSTYISKWHGPFAGLDLDLRPWPRFSLFGSVEYHWAAYEADADWNLRDDLFHPLSFRHEADKAVGLVWSIGARYIFSNAWGLDLSYGHRDFTTKDGQDQTYLADGSIVVSQLNEAHWQSSVTSFSLSYSFY